MKKQSISVINCFLSVFIFLCVFGNTCYRHALPGKGGADFAQQTALCFYFAIFVVIAICCICAKPYYSNKCFWFGAIFCMLFPVLLFSLWICSLIINWEFSSINWLYWICIIIPPIISGLYVCAALTKK